MYCPEDGTKCRETDPQYNPVYECPKCKTSFQYLSELSGGPVYAILSEEDLARMYPCPTCNGNSDKCECL